MTAWASLSPSAWAWAIHSAVNSFILARASGKFSRIHLLMARTLAWLPGSRLAGTLSSALARSVLLYQP